MILAGVARRHLGVVIRLVGVQAAAFRLPLPRRRGTGAILSIEGIQKTAVPVDVSWGSSLETKVRERILVQAVGREAPASFRNLSRGRDRVDAMEPNPRGVAGMPVGDRYLYSPGIDCPTAKVERATRRWWPYPR